MSVIDGLILTAENRTSGRKTCPSVIFSFSNLTCTDQGLNLGVRSERREWKLT